MRSWIAATLLVAACSGGHHPAPNPPVPAGSATPVAAGSATPAAPVVPPPPAPASTTTLAAAGLDGALLDRKADPCDDFYQYACGGWLATHPIPDDMPSFGSFEGILQSNEDYLHGILDQAAAAKGGKDPLLAQMGTFYASCMDEAAVDARGLTSVKRFTDLIAKVKDPRSLTAAIAQLQLAGVHVGWNFGATPDAKDVDQVIGGFVQGGLGLPDRQYYVDDDDQSKALRGLYENYVATMLGLAGASADDAKKGAADVLALETELAKASKTNVEMRDPHGLYHRVERAGLVKAAPHLDWKGYFTALGVAKLDKITVSSTEFLAGVDKVATTTPVAAWKSYLTFHLLNDLAGAVGTKFHDAQFGFERILTGQKVDAPRWKRCVRATDGVLGQVVGQSYVRDRFGGDSRDRAQAMVKAIVGAMEQNLAALPWMDDATRQKAVAKLHAMTFQVGYPDKWRVYPFKLDAKEYAANVLASRTFEFKRDLGKIGKPFDRTDWQMTPATVNAYYDPQINGMVFPAGIMQPPFFSAQSAVPVNLGAMGAVMGHELTHGFDDEGAQYDAAGNLIDWWSADVGPKFKAKTQCVIDQYGGYEAAPGVKLNGELTTGENIADIGGVKLAYRAYKALRAGATDPQVADGFDEDQQFFLAYGRAWCTKIRPELVELLAKVDPHSPAHWRVDGALADTPEFAAAFHCKVGTRMHPANACSVW